MTTTPRSIPTIPRLRTLLNSFRFVRVPLDVLNQNIRT